MHNSHDRPPTVQLQKRRHVKSLYIKTACRFAAALLIIAVLAALLTSLWFPVLKINGHSMSPTLTAGEMVLSVKQCEPENNDIIAFWHNGKILVKRIIASSGDWVEISAYGTISINGVALDEPYILVKGIGQYDLVFPYQVPDGTWFVAGDNRELSNDSRYLDFGCISRNQLIGKAIFRIWPITKLGRVR